MSNLFEGFFNFAFTRRKERTMLRKILTTALALFAWTSWLTSLSEDSEEGDRGTILDPDG